MWDLGGLTSCRSIAGRCFDCLCPSYRGEFEMLMLLPHATVDAQTVQKIDTKPSALVYSDKALYLHTSFLGSTHTSNHSPEYALTQPEFLYLLGILYSKVPLAPLGRTSPEGFHLPPSTLCNRKDSRLMVRESSSYLKSSQNGSCTGFALHLSQWVHAPFGCDLE